jgi:DNA polymerase-3 subunit beta
MILSLPVAELKRLSSHLRPLNLQKLTLPVLQHVRLQRLNHSVAAYASTLDAALIAPLKASACSGSLHASVPAALLLRMAREADAGTSVTMQLVENVGQWQWISKGLPVDQHEPIIAAHEFPGMDTSGFAHGMMVGPEMVKLLSAALPHVSSDETRYVLQGVYFDAAEHALVATDGRRLIRASSPVAIPCNAILPLAAVNCLTAHAATDGAPMWFRMPAEKAKEGNSAFPPQASDVMISLPEGALAVFRLIEGNYPNYRQVIPEQCHYTATFGSAEHRQALLKRLRSLHDDASVIVRLQQRECSLRIDYGKADGRQSHAFQEIGPCNYSSSTPLLICFTAAYFTDGIAAVENPQLFFIDEMSPLSIDGAGTRVVIMPRRTDATVISRSVKEQAPVAA